MKTLSIFITMAFMIFGIRCMDVNPNGGQEEFGGEIDLISGNSDFYENYSTDSEQLLTDESIIAQLQAKQIANIHTNQLARPLSEDKTYDFYNTTFINLPYADIDVLKSPEVGETYKSVLYSYVKDGVVLEKSIILDFEESDTTYYSYFHDGTPLYSMQLFDTGIIVLYPPPAGSSDEVFSWWSDFEECWSTEMTAGIQVIIGTSGSAAYMAGSLGASATTVGLWGAAGFGAFWGVNLGCAAAVSVIMYGT